jgi:hypothetical protein
MIRIAIAATLLFSVSAFAQAQQQPDPRLAGLMMQAQSSQIALLQGMVRVNEEDLAAERVTLAPALNAYRWFATPLWRLQ